MKPLHGEFIRLNRCPCCQTKYSRHGARKTSVGKKVARQRSKTAIRKELD